MIAEVNSLLTGWVTYCCMARCKKQLEQMERWLRHRLRCFRIKPCKRITPLVDFLRRQGVPAARVWMGGALGKGWWRTAGRPPVHEAMPNVWFKARNRLGPQNLCRVV